MKKMSEPIKWETARRGFYRPLPSALIFAPAFLLMFNINPKARA